MRKIVVAVGGSSGAIYAKVLLDKLLALQDQIEAVGVVMSDNARFNWKFELETKSYLNYPFQFYATKTTSWRPSLPARPATTP
jgi:flavin prenyltransferase